MTPWLNCSPQSICFSGCIALGAALFLPVRQLIWVLYVRRAERDGSETSDEERLALRKRAGMTAVLLCFVFSYFYMNHLFR